MIINPFQSQGPIDKRITLKTKLGEQLSLDVTLQDEHGRDSAAAYINHLYTSIKEKLGEPVIFTGENSSQTLSEAELQKIILFIAAFHDSMFGTFNKQAPSQIPDEERQEFIELFLLACASVLSGRNLLIDLSKGQISNEGRLS